MTRSSSIVCQTHRAFQCNPRFDGKFGQARHHRLYSNSVDSPFIQPIFDYKSLRVRADEMRNSIRDRNIEWPHGCNVDRVLQLKDSSTELVNKIYKIRARRNSIATALSEHRAAGGSTSLQEEGRRLKLQCSQLDDELRRVDKELLEHTAMLPNWIHPSVPRRGEPPRILATVGEKPNSNSQHQLKSHLEIGKLYDLLHFPRTVGSSKFYFAKRDVALLEVALINWAMNIVSSKYNFVPYTCPDLMHHKYLDACGFQPRTPATQVYSVENSELSLVGTQEIPLASLYYNTILCETQLPIKLVGYGHCFRHETGTTSESRGLYRVHQFTKVEMFVLSKPEQSEQLHDELLSIQINLFKSLGLHFNVLDMPSDDLGASASRKYDIEAYMPYKNGFGEISSCSNCLDYQSRRLGIKFRRNSSNCKPEHVHTLNATAVAVPRITLAILENFQNSNGKILIPEPLVPFMNGKKYIECSKDIQ